MKAVIQRVKKANVEVDSSQVAEIGPGILTFLGIEKGDSEEQLKKLIEKICHLRIFEDDHGKMNLSLIDKKAEHLIVSQFTIAADCSKGRRPSFTTAESPILAEKIYLQAIEYSKQLGVKTAAGQFQADMQVQLINDGPVTFILEV